MSGRKRKIPCSLCDEKNTCYAIYAVKENGSSTHGKCCYKMLEAVQRWGIATKKTNDGCASVFSESLDVSAFMLSRQVPVSCTAATCGYH